MTKGHPALPASSTLTYLQVGTTSLASMTRHLHVIGSVAPLEEMYWVSQQVLTSLCYDNHASCIHVHAQAHTHACLFLTGWLCLTRACVHLDQRAGWMRPGHGSQQAGAPCSQQQYSMHVCYGRGRGLWLAGRGSAAVTQSWPRRVFRPCQHLLVGVLASKRSPPLLHPLCTWLTLPIYPTLSSLWHVASIYMMLLLPKLAQVCCVVLYAAAVHGVHTSWVPVLLLGP